MMGSGNKVTILVADDNPQNLLTIEAILETEQYNVVTVRSGKDALKYLLDNEVALVILDVLMPGLNGFETAKTIRDREKTKRVPIIFTSGFQVDETDVYLGYDLGAIDYMTLPLIPYVVKAKVAALVSLYLKEKDLLAQMERIHQIEKLQFEHEKKLLLQEGERQKWELERAHQQQEMEREQRIASLTQEKALALEKVNSELTRFSTVVAHDLQEPLRTVSCYLSLLLEEISTEQSAKAKEYIQFVQDASKRMSTLISDLLKYSQINNQKEESLAVCDFAEVIQKAVKNLDGAIQHSRAEILYSDLPQVYGNKGQLTQVVQNLISNAIKFAPERTPKIEVKVEDDSEMLTFHFSDNGVGIPKESLGKVFTPFERLHNRTLFPGTGIGLAICKKNIEKHGGKIWVESVESQGTTFSFSLPKPAAKTSERENQAPLEGMRVLVVDDDDSIGLLLSRYFTQYGAAMDVAQSGKSAILKIKEKEYDSIILDIQMPDMDGIETMERIRRNGVKTPTTAYTSMDFSESKNKFLSAGFSEVVSKQNGLPGLTQFLRKHYKAKDSQADTVDRGNESRVNPV